MVQIARRDPSGLKAPTNRMRRKARPVFDPIESFFLNGRHELTIDHQRRGGVAMVSVNPKDVHCAPDFLSGFDSGCSALPPRRQAAEFLLIIIEKQWRSS
jgi:hypothetical protein